MNTRATLALVLLAAVLIAAAVSHSLTAWLRIETRPGQFGSRGRDDAATRAFVAGSSLAFDGIAWSEVADQLDQKIQLVGVAGSSPSEWQVLQDHAAGAHATYLVISAYDMNEDFLCDFHANTVPITQTVRDLRLSRIDFAFWKRTLGAYPVRYVRIAFPTAGRAEGVLSGLRAKAHQWLGRGEAEAGPSLGVTEDRGAHLRISDWPPDRALRRLAVMRSACEGRHRFDGPKAVALNRMLMRASREGAVTVVVLPVSPMYGTEFLKPDITAAFEQMIVGAGRGAPAARWIRLDRLPSLQSNALYSDLVHLNRHGRDIATAALLAELPPAGHTAAAADAP